MASTISTSEKILDVAQSLIVTGGYNGFSYADISAAIGIRKASIHHHFPTKCELVVALLDRYRQRAEAGLKSLGEHVSNPVEQLQSYVNYWQTCILDTSAPFCVCAMLAAEIQMLPAEVSSGVHAYFTKLSEWLQCVLMAGEKESVFRLENRAEVEAQILMASVHGAMLSARAFGEPNIFGAIMNPQIARLRVKK